ncbi:hypothetical protein ILUMI_10177 [Ignelater luminosus]|uniref:PiggyBac transposable element-derived protein domain-containing protein n=1 Tax=Ignelater luminosus TaxID=2038154 RepID=A0A8K0D3R8_IGNLU|nr:hypothetical protein ILUMI_10177 [Ignelater luminosus]
MKNSKLIKNRHWTKGDLQKNPESQTSVKRLPPIILSKYSEPLEFLELFLSLDFLETLVKNTVIYAASKNYKLEVGNEEMLVFISILYISRYVPVPHRRMFWEGRPDTKNTLVSNSMRRNRFEDIFRYIHAADNNNLPKNDKMAKLRPLIEKVNKLFIRYTPVSEDMSIDESMIPYFGRNGCKQFIRGKPIRFGYKAWVLAQPSGANLITKLEKINFSGTGTVRDNRIDKCPIEDSAIMKKKPRGTFGSFVDRENNIVCVKWRDNSVVTVLSNKYGIAPFRKAPRYSVKEKSKIEIPQPNVVSCYNQSIGGVEFMDNNISNYRIGFRGKKWYIPILFWTFDVCMNNAWILSRHLGKQMDNLEFRRVAAISVLQKYGKPPLATGPRTNFLFVRVSLLLNKHGDISLEVRDSNDLQWDSN